MNISENGGTSAVHLTIARINPVISCGVLSLQSSWMRAAFSVWLDGFSCFCGNAWGKTFLTCKFSTCLLSKLPETLKSTRDS